MANPSLSQFVASLSYPGADGALLDATVIILRDNGLTVRAHVLSCLLGR